MIFSKFYKSKIVILVFAFSLVFTLCYLQAYFALPQEITLIEGQEHVYYFGSPFSVRMEIEKDGLLMVNQDYIPASGTVLNLSRPVSFRSDKNGSVKMHLKVFGLIPLRTVTVDIVNNKKVVPCGNTVGVKLELDGILIVGTTDIDAADGGRRFPAQEAGLRPGDMITRINGNPVNKIRQLIDLIESSRGRDMQIQYVRNGEVANTVIRAVRSVEDNRYHLGLWVRDNTAGIGTLTFYDPESNVFAALGHGITDIDTGTLMSVSTGEILESEILDIKKGRQGIPGELRGVFVENENKLGEITSNTQSGIYGRLYENSLARLPQKAYPIGVRSQVQTGKASILANVDGKKVEEFEILIEKINRQNTNGTKGMIIRIVDPKLLEMTGGIVQGMSGSPIIQNGVLVGAVTHVLVNDPTRGYGIFIEFMLKNIDKTLAELDMAG